MNAARDLDVKMPNDDFRRFFACFLPATAFPSLAFPLLHIPHKDAYIAEKRRAASGRPNTGTTVEVAGAGR